MSGFRLMAVLRAVPGWLLVMAVVSLLEAFFAPERERHQTAHIEGGETRGKESDDPQHLGGGLVRCKRASENLILRPESRKWNDPAYRQPADQHRLVCYRHVLREA